MSRPPFKPIDLASARLEDFSRFPGCVLFLGCEICGWGKGYDVMKVIKRLYDLRNGGFMTPVADVASQVRRPCPHCKGLHWSTQFAYPAHLAERRARLARRV